MVAPRGPRSGISITVGVYRPTVYSVLLLLAFTVVSVFWALRLTDAAVQVERIAAAELVAGRVADFVNEVRQVAAPSGYRQAVYVLVGGVVLIFVVSVATVAYLNIALARARGRLKRQKTDLRTVDVVKERFLTSVTHELNTPITVTTALADALFKNRDGNLTDRQLEQLTAVRRNNRRLSDIVDAMIRTSTAEVDLGLITEKVRYSDFVEATLESLRTDIALQGRRIESPGISFDALVSIDPDRIAQVLINLLVNAADSSPDGSAILVTTERSDNGVRTCVQDSGTGISEPDAGHVFSPFYRGDTEFTRRTRGLGLGLTIVQRIVDLHGGEVGFGQNEGQAGMTFWFTLPTVD